MGWAPMRSTSMPAAKLANRSATVSPMPAATPKAAAAITMSPGAGDVVGRARPRAEHLGLARRGAVVEPFAVESHDRRVEAELAR